MYTKVFAAAVQGIDALICTIEVSTSRGIKFFLVGLPDNAVKESHERINSAFHMYGLSMPSKQIVINMAPADVRKEGSAFDLPIAVGIMVVGGMISCSALEKYLIMGELGLDGSLFPIKGALPIAVKAMKEGFEGVILPAQNSAEAAVVNGIKVYGASSLKEVMEFLSGSGCLEPAPSTDTSILEREREYVQDFAYVKGQESVKRALEVSAAGGHNLIMVGPPGSGKSMMAQCLPSILPPLTPEESLETTKIHSVAGLTGKNALITTRPFRSPHHTISRVAFVGGGSNYPKPGEISLAHNGILFADELPEFNRSSLEVLRQPLEERHIRIDRANYNVEYPASFMFVASMNPCPCGYYNHPAKECVCNSIQIY